jgi:hypothetical protein
VEQQRSPAASSEAAASPATVMSHPYSTRAYRARLQLGNFTSLRELTRAAYAPCPLSVLVDLLRLSAAHSPDGQRLSSPSYRSVHHALERALDVQWVLNTALAEARDTVLAAETVGDAVSHSALHELLQHIEVLANATEESARGTFVAATPLQLQGNSPTSLPLQLADQGTEHDSEAQPRPLQDHNAVWDGPAQHSAGDDAGDESPSPWVLPTATHATLLRGVLQLSAVAGAHLHALTALDELIALHERQQRASSRITSSSRAAEDNEEEDSFSMDDAVAVIDAAAQRHVAPLTAQDHLCAMHSCASERHRDFRTTLSLYHRFVQHVKAGRFAATAADFTDALVALAHSSRNTTDFTELRALIVASEAAATVPVSVPLYTALIDAASRAVEEPQRMSMALSLYRRLRDGALTPVADTYAALIACCASTREPTHAFAFYHEARQVCGVASFSPRVYTNLLLSYSTAGYGADARKTLDVLVEAGAPLTRASFHAVLASAVTVRDAREIMELMTERYHIAPTPQSYAYVVQAIARAPAGVSTALQLFDVHEETLRSLARISATAAASASRGVDNSDAHSTDGEHGGFAVSASADGVALEPLLLEHYPAYVAALEHALMRLRIDPAQDPRLKAYLNPLVRVAQHRMNAFVGMPPQSPIKVPDKERLCIAVLAADVLANLEEWVMPFMSHYSVLVIPYSAVLSLQRGGGHRIEGAMAKGAAAGLHDPVWQETAGGSEHDAVVEHRRRRLAAFLAEHRDVVHLVSLEDELRWSRETRRYGVGITDLFARAAVVALHLARGTDVDGDGLSSPNARSSVYARHASTSIVLVSANYERCGKYVVALRQDQGRERGSAGLQAALRRVSYHNPRTNPNWIPPNLSITRQQQQAHHQRPPQHDDGSEASGATAVEGNGTKDSAPSTKAEGARPTPATATTASAVNADAASELYRHLLCPTSGPVGDSGNKSVGNANEEERHAEPAAEDAEEMDASLLMSLLNE